MKYPKMATIAAVVIAAVSMLATASISSATNLYKYTTPSANDRLALGTEIVGSLESGTSLLWKDTLGGANDTCTGSEFKGKLERDTSTSGDAAGKLSTLTFTGCSHTTTVLAPGEWEIKAIAGTTNGTLISRGMRVTTKTTIFGISCVAATGAGTTIGTVTGAKSSTAKATVDINGVITKENGCGDSTWTGSYLITSPVGLTIEPDF